MKLRLTFILLLTFYCCGELYSQCDSLSKAAINEKGILKVDALNEFARCYLGPDFLKMDSLTDRALQLASNLNYLSGMARSKQNKGLYAFYYEQDAEKALSLYEEALELYITADDSLGMAKAWGDIGSYHQGNGNNAEAIKNYIAALEVCEKYENRRGISVFSNNIGTIFTLSEDHEESKYYYEKALMYSDSIKDPINYGIQLNNVLSAWVNLKEKDSAHYYFDHTIRFNKAIKSPNGISSAYHNLIKLYEDVKDPKDPDFNLRKKNVDSLYKYSFNSKDLSRHNYAVYMKGLIDFYEGKYASAKEKFLSITAVPETEQDLSSQRSLVHLAIIYAKEGNFEVAYDYLIQAYNFIIETNKNEQAALVEKMKSQFQVDQAKKEIDLIKKDKEVTELELEVAEKNNIQKDLEAKKRNAQIFGIGIGLALSLVLAFIALRGYRNKQKANIIITQQKEEVELQKEEAEKQKAIVQEKNTEILDSINYAKRIQKAILPSDKAMRENLPNSFVLYKPKDIVAGDFYWLEKSHDSVFFAAADCTGHGVPGAMVSVICNNGLNRSVREHKLIRPAEILNKTREIVVEEFSKSEDEVKDGMDIALCAINGYKLEYAGANNPLWIVRNKELIEIKGDKQPIGKFEYKTDFVNHSITLEKGDHVYIFSDGYADQFGGEKGKKFKSANLKKLLLSVNDMSIEEQKLHIEAIFEKWRGSLEQLDDVCLIGVKIA